MKPNRTAGLLILVTTIVISLAFIRSDAVTTMTARPETDVRPGVGSGYSAVIDDGTPDDGGAIPAGCSPDADGDGFVNVVDIQRRASDLNCLIFLPLIASYWRQTVPTAIPAFPGAEGFGAQATGGRGGQVITELSVQFTGIEGYTNLEVYLNALVDSLVDSATTAHVATPARFPYLPPIGLASGACVFRPATG